MKKIALSYHCNYLQAKTPWKKKKQTHSTSLVVRAIFLIVFEIW